jgi:hypothetical protein
VPSGPDAQDAHLRGDQHGDPGRDQTLLALLAGESIVIPNPNREGRDVKSVLVLSKWNNSSPVAQIAELLRSRGLRSVLISASPDDSNRDKCDDHVLLDWDSEDLPTLIARLDQRGVTPIGVANVV